jgi:hypothetical protein
MPFAVFEQQIDRIDFHRHARSQSLRLTNPGAHRYDRAVVWTYLLVLLVIFATLLVLLAILAFLGRFRGGRYLRPIVATLSKIPFMRRWFERMSNAALEKQNPELASAIRKMQRFGTNIDPQRAQQALSSLSASERRAYLDAVQEQGAMPEGANRQMRRQQQKLQQGSRPGGTTKRAGKKRR